MSIREKWELDAKNSANRETAVNLLNNGAEEDLVKSSMGFSDEDFDEILKAASSSSEA